MRARTWIVLAVLLAAYAGVLRADETEDVPETWRFVRDGVERVVDVSAMPPFVREALVERLTGEGFVRVEGSGSAGRRDLGEDARTLIRNGGRFPVERGTRPTLEDLAPSIATTLRALAEDAPGSPAAGRALRLAELLEAPRTGRPAAGPATGVVLGAPVVVVQGGWRVRSVPDGTVAAALGLRAGARILGVGALAATPDTLRLWQDPLPDGPQRALQILRTDGRVETWTLRCEPPLVRRRPPHPRQGP